MRDKRQAIKAMLFRLKMKTHNINTLKSIARSAMGIDSSYSLAELSVVLEVLREKMIDEEYTEFVMNLTEDTP